MERKQSENTVCSCNEIWGKNVMEAREAFNV